MSKKYTLDNLVNEDLIYLIGLNSSLDSYNLVFKLNKKLNINFVRSKKDIDLPKEKHIIIALLLKTNLRRFCMIFSNKFQKISFSNRVSKLDLFNSPFSKKVLLKEYKEADYFIKSTDQKIILK